MTREEAREALERARKALRNGAWNSGITSLSCGATDTVLAGIDAGIAALAAPPAGEEACAEAEKRIAALTDALRGVITLSRQLHEYINFMALGDDSASNAARLRRQFEAAGNEADALLAAAPADKEGASHE